MKKNKSVRLGRNLRGSFDPKREEVVLRIKLDPREHQSERGHYGLAGMDRSDLSVIDKRLHGVVLSVTSYLNGDVCRPSKLFGRLKK